MRRLRDGAQITLYTYSHGTTLEDDLSEHEIISRYRNVFSKINQRLSQAKIEKGIIPKSDIFFGGYVSGRLAYPSNGYIPAETLTPEDFEAQRTYPRFRALLSTSI